MFLKLHVKNLGIYRAVKIEMSMYITGQLGFVVISDRILLNFIMITCTLKTFLSDFELIIHDPTEIKSVLKRTPPLTYSFRSRQ